MKRVTVVLPAAAIFVLVILIGAFINSGRAGAQQEQAQVPSQRPASPVDIVNPLPLPVTLAGGQGGTVAVKNVDEPGRAPFYFAGSATADATFTVPADKILVVDHFSTFAEWSSACTPSCFFQNLIRETLVGGGFHDRYFVARPLTTGLASEEEMVRWYFAPDSSVRVGWASRAIGTFHADHFAMSGYYIDAN